MIRRVFFILLLFVSTAHADTVISSYPGNVARVVFQTESSVEKILADFKGSRIEFFKTQEGFRGFLPALPEDKPGKYKFIVSLKRKDGGEEKFAKWIILNSKKFPTVYFTVAPLRKKLRAHVEDEWAEIEKILIKSNPEQLWKGKFITPLSSMITMHYGTREFVNRKPSGYHRGVDFRAAIGAKIAAANSGIVSYAKNLKAFGGTMVIDHGQGVYSLYFHLSKFIVPVGTKVSKKEIVALSGDSGISSGPHLHWGLSVHNVRVNPLQWTKEEM